MSLNIIKWMTNILLLVVLSFSTFIYASPVVKNTIQSIDLKPFSANSLAQITENRAGQAFIMVLWSIDCPPCLKELEHFQAVKAQLTKTNIVLVSTDNPDDSASIQQVLIDNQLQTIDNWIFSDSLPERLRYKIDPNWYGELPRAYFYEADHQRKAHSGMLTQAQLQQWLQKHTSLVSLNQ